MLSTIDFEKVDMGLMNILSVLHALEYVILQKSEISGSSDMITQIDRYRNEVALEIERQGKRS